MNGTLLGLAIVAASYAAIGYYWRKQAEEMRRLAEENYRQAKANREDAETIAAMAEANVNASRWLSAATAMRGASQEDVPRCQCGLLLRKTRPGEAGYPEARMCPMRPTHPGHDSWVPQAH